MPRITSTVYLLISLLCISLAIVAMLAGCDEKTIDTPILGPAAGSGPVGGGETQKIQLSASPSETIPTIGEASATATITALVQNNIGQPVPDGTAVYWSTTTGTLNTTNQATSNGSSAVTLTFTPNFTGCSTVTAESGDAKDSIQICTTNMTPTPTVTVTPTPSANFVVSSSAPTIAHGGKSTITAYAATDGVADANLQVNFSVSTGGVLSASAATTDAAGNAQVIFTGNNTSSGDITATITATTADGRSGTTTVIVSSGATPTPTPTLTPTPKPAATATPTVSLTLAAGTNPVICSASEQSILTATVTSGGVALQNVQVAFSASSTSEGSLSATSAETNSSGEAEVTYSTNASSSCPAAGTNANVTFTATAYGQSATVTITVNP